MSNQSQNPFKWRHYQAEIILVCIRWYLRYSLSYRDLEEIILERGLHVDYTTIQRWVQHFAPELDRRCRSSLQATTDSWRVDETYITIKKQWMYLYRAVDAQGNTLVFLLSPTRDGEAAKRFFLKTRTASHTTEPHVITVAQNAAYPKAFAKLKAAGQIPEAVNCGKGSTSIMWSSKTIASSNDSSNQGWASFPYRRHSEH
jgi:transposase, IS6 family